jgi:hypothetical protein
MQLDREFFLESMRMAGSSASKKSGQPKLPCLLMIFEELRW